MGTRIVSAIVAALIVILSVYFFKIPGMRVIACVVTFLSILEFRRLTFSRGQWPRHLQAAFVGLSILIFASTVFDVSASGIAFAICTAIYFAMALLTIRSTEHLSEVLNISGISALGFLYCGLYAGFATAVLGLPDGGAWFIGLMAIVFAGDTFAYFAGYWFGKSKLLEPVSPKKTVEGSVGGLIGSGLAGLVLAEVGLAGRPVAAVIVMALATGAFAQIGDLFESLLKRVANVKDSGAIMPGHGGMLDRIDGLLFAAPVYYLLARLLS